MKEALILYLFTRLDVIGFVVSVVWFLMLIGTVISLCAAASLKMEDIDPPPFFKKLWIWFAVVSFIGILIPSQKSVAIILAGSSIMQVAKTEDAQRIAGKSVRLIEQYLDSMQKEGKK